MVQARRVGGTLCKDRQTGCLREGVGIEKLRQAINTIIMKRSEKKLSRYTQF